jgi:amino acid transporter
MLSLAEMASMAPTAGGQYHWVSEFSPPSLQKPMSFFVGWMSTLSWQAGTASGPFLVGTLIQASVIVMYPDYTPHGHSGYPSSVGTEHMGCQIDAHVPERHADRSRLRVFDNHHHFLGALTESLGRSDIHPVHKWWRLEFNGAHSDGWAAVFHLCMHM